MTMILSSLPKANGPNAFKLCLSLLIAVAISSVSCQEPELDDQFQDFHHDLGRISGGASHTAPAPVARQQTPVIRPQPVAQTQPKPAVQSQQRVQHQHHAGPKRNRITLAVRPHTPAPAPSIGQLEPDAAPSIVPVSQPITQPIVSPIQPQVISTRSADLHQQSNQYASLMARVAAEREGRDQDSPREDFAAPQITAHSAVPSASHPLPLVAHQFQAAQPSNTRQPLASFQSPTTLAQVVAPPAAPQSFSSLLEPQTQPQPVALASAAPAFGDQPEEQIEAPTFQHVLSNGCPRKGVFSWDNKDHCDRYYMCTNGTFTEEACPNGLAYSQMGAVYQHCAYQWNVDCGTKKSPGPLASPGCPWQFGIFPTSAAAQCSIDYFVCEWGVPEKKRCQPEGLFYDDRIKGCQWADQLGCKSEALLNFKCPPEDEDNAFWPFPRYYHTKQDVIVCVNEQPRLVHCTEEQVVEPSSLSCIDLKKKKKKF